MTRATAILLGLMCGAAVASATACGSDDSVPSAPEDTDAGDASTKPDTSTSDASASDTSTSDAKGDEDATVDAADAADASDASDAADAPDVTPSNDAAVLSIVDTAESMCVLRVDGKMKCWGEGNFLGTGMTSNLGDNAGEMGSALPFTNLGTGVWAIAAGGGSYAYHRCAILNTGLLRCWGDNSSGNLGIGDTVLRGNMPNQMGDNLPTVDLGTGRTAKRVATTNGFTCAILDDGNVKCWGANESGELGLGDTNNRGDNAGEMGNNLPKVNFGTGRTAKAVTLGRSRVCVITDEDKVKCWGFGGSGALGTGNTSNVGAQAAQMGDALPYVDLGAGRTVLQVANGLDHSCALLDDHTVKCWGYNVYGQLGLGDTNNRGDNANEMGSSLPTVNLGTGRTAKAIDVGPHHSCAILDDDSLKCWGDNNQGQLGQGNTSNRGDNGGEMGDSLPAIALGTGRTAKAVACGSSSTCALLDDGHVKCWGYNSYGQLGLGDTNNRGDNANEMGDSLPALDFGP